MQAEVIMIPSQDKPKVKAEEKPATDLQCGICGKMYPK